MTEHWREDMVAFLIGCSFTFERALLAGLPVRHIEQGVNVPMYRTNVACRPAGRFSGPLVVSMRPMRRAGDPRDADDDALPAGARRAGPRRRPGGIGIADLAARFRRRGGGAPRRGAGVLGVRRHAAGGRDAGRPPLLITHAPGHMFVTDARDETMATF